MLPTHDELLDAAHTTLQKVQQSGTLTPDQGIAYAKVLIDFAREIRKRPQPSTATPINPGNWIPWFGETCPVLPRTLVDYELRDGTLGSTQYPESLRWHRARVKEGELAKWDIVAYRITPVKETP